MSQFTIYIKTIIVLILLKQILEEIMPGKKFNKYIRLVFGLVMITLLIIPFTKELPGLIYELESSYEDVSYNNIYINVVEQEIELRLNEAFGTDDVDVKIDDNFKIIDVFSKEQSAIKEYLGL